MKNAVKVIVVAAIAVSGLAAWRFGFYESNESQDFCTLSEESCSYESSTGTLKGKVLIGPLCPVEPCPETVFNPYASRTITLSKQGQEPLYSIALEEDGSFESKVEAGAYTLNLSDCSFLGCRYSLPKTVAVLENETTEINVNIDTGIR